MSIARMTPVFSAAFALFYVIAVEANIAAVTYHPKTGAWGLGTEAAVDGPAMHWYGWLITATGGAVVISMVALPFTGRRPPPVWIGWVVPLGVMIAFLYLLRSFFIY